MILSSKGVERSHDTGYSVKTRGSSVPFLTGLVQRILIFCVKTLLGLTVSKQYRPTFVLRFTIDAYLRRSVVGRVNQEITQCYLPPTRLSTDAISHAPFNPKLQGVTAFWPVLISHPAEGRRLS